MGGEGLRGDGRAAKRDGSGFKVSVYERLADISDWPLVTQSGDATGFAFQSRDVLEVWLDTIGAARGTRPCLVRVSLGDDVPTLFLPLGIERRRGVRILGFLDGGVMDYNAPVLLPSFGDLDRDEVGGLWKQIVAALPGFDVASLEKMPDTIGERANPFRALAKEPQGYSGYVLPLASTWAEIARSLPRGQDSRRKRRRMQDVGAVSFKIAQSPAEVDHFLDALVRQKRRRYLETKGTDGLARPGYLDYLRQSTVRLGPSGRAQLSALFCGDTIVAAHWGIVAADRFYYLMPSFEAGDWLKFSPGRLIVEDLLEWCAGQHIGKFDFGVGDEPYKVEFAADRIPLWRGLIVRTPLGAAYAAIQQGRSRLLASSMGPKLREFRARTRKTLSGNGG